MARTVATRRTLPVDATLTSESPYQVEKRVVSIRLVDRKLELAMKRDMCSRRVEDIASFKPSKKTHETIDRLHPFIVWSCALAKPTGKPL